MAFIKSSTLLGLPTPEVTPAVMAFLNQYGRSIGHKILPPVRADKFDGTFYKVPAKMLGQGGTTTRAFGAAANVGQLQLDADSYHVVSNDFAFPLAIEHEEQAPFMRSVAAGLAGLVCLRAYEARVKTSLASAASTQAAGASWSSAPTTASPVTDVVAAAQQITTKYGPTIDQLTLVLPYQRFTSMSLITDVRQTLSVTNTISQQLSTEALRQYFGVKEVIVPSLTVDSANLGQAISMGYIFTSAEAYLVYNGSDNADGSVSNVGGFGRTFFKDNLSQMDQDATADMSDMAMDGDRVPILYRQFWEPDARSNVMGAGHYTHEKVINAEAACIITGISA